MKLEYVIQKKDGGKWKDIYSSSEIKDACGSLIKHSKDNPNVPCRIIKRKVDEAHT